MCKSVQVYAIIIPTNYNYVRIMRGHYDDATLSVYSRYKFTTATAVTASVNFEFSPLHVSLSSELFLSRRPNDKIFFTVSFSYVSYVSSSSSSLARHHVSFGFGFPGLPNVKIHAKLLTLSPYEHVPVRIHCLLIVR